MKRDLDLFRAILFRLESLNTYQHRIQLQNFSDLAPDWDTLVLHFELLRDSGFIECLDNSTMSSRNFIIIRMTNQGYDYLDAIRSDSVWQSVKEKLSSVGGSASSELISQIAHSLIKVTLGI